MTINFDDGSVPPPPIGHQTSQGPSVKKIQLPIPQTSNNKDVKPLSKKRVQEAKQLPKVPKKTAKRVHAHIMTKVQLKESVERFESVVSSLPTAESHKLLTKRLENEGMASALTLLDHITEAKIQRGKRYNSISSWPSSRQSSYLHIERKVGKEAKSPLPSGSPLVDVMEPPLDKIITIGDVSYTYAELLLMTNVPKQFEAAKRDIDAYYKNKSYFKIELSSQNMLISVPTHRYTPNQFIAVALPQRQDVLKEAHTIREQKRDKLVETSSKGSLSFVGALPPKLSTEDIKTLLSSIKEKSRPEQLQSNTNNIRSMAELSLKLPPGSFIGQNSLDTSSDATYQHLQLFTNAPTHLIPLFNTAGTTIAINDNLKCEQLDEKEFPVPVFKVTANKNDLATQKYLESVQNTFNTEEHKDTSMNLVTHIRKDGKFEFYFILRKNLDTNPELKEVYSSKNCNRPGWAEMCGIRIAGNPEIFERIPDETYKNEILAPFAASQEHKEDFRSIISKI